MLRSLISFISIVACMIIGISCSPSKTTPSTPRFAEKKFTGPWSMDERTFEIFKTRVNALKLGERIGQVTAQLGAPDDDKTEKKNDQVRILTYYVSRQRSDSPLNSDKVVLIGLDANEKVKAIYSNVNDITTRGVGNKPLE